MITFFWHARQKPLGRFNSCGMVQLHCCTSLSLRLLVANQPDRRDESLAEQGKLWKILSIPWPHRFAGTTRRRKCALNPCSFFAQAQPVLF